MFFKFLKEKKNRYACSYKHSSLISFCSLLLIAFSCLLLIPYWLLVFCYQFVRNFGFSLVVFVLKFFLFLWGQILFSLCITWPL